MSIFLTILGMLLLVLLLVLLSAVVMPLRLEMKIIRQENWQYAAALRPFGRFGPRIKLNSRKKKTNAPRKRSPRKRFFSGSRRQRSRNFLRPALRLGADILHAIDLGEVMVDLRFGFDDPAETGEVFGKVAPLVYGLSNSRKIHVNVAPNFHQAALNGRAEMDLILIPAALFVPALRFGWSAFGPRL